MVPSLLELLLPAIPKLQAHLRQLVNRNRPRVNSPDSLPLVGKLPIPALIRLARVLNIRTRQLTVHEMLPTAYQCLKANPWYTEITSRVSRTLMGAGKKYGFQMGLQNILMQQNCPRSVMIKRQRTLMTNLDRRENGKEGSCRYYHRGGNGQSGISSNIGREGARCIW